MSATKATKTPSAAPKSNVPKAHAVGRRKSSVARVWIRRGSGTLKVNGEEYANYFDTDLMRFQAYAPFRYFAPAKTYDAEVNVQGGGLSGQADAVMLGVARALVELDDRARQVYRDHGLLTVDARVKERKKYGQKAARRKFQFVKR